MRAGLATIAALALCATPAVAQGKTKPGGAVLQNVAALEMFLSSSSPSLTPKDGADQ